MQQRLSPQQIQYIKLLQLPTLMLEQRIKQELENNPALELEEDDTTNDEPSAESETDSDELSSDDESAASNTTESEESSETDSSQTDDESDDEPSAVDENPEIDWESYFHNDEDEYVPSYSKEQEDWRDLPKPYKTSFTEQLEQQVELLNLDERQQKVADQIIGSIDSDGYLRRDLDTIIDSVAFNDDVLVTPSEAEQVLHQIQRLDPPGIAARNLRECLLVQLELMDSNRPGRKVAMDILEKAWPQFEKKHYEKIRRKLNLTDEQLRGANQIIMLLDPKPGESDEYLNPDQFIVPDFEVYYEESIEGDEETGDFIIRLNSRNMPGIKISRYYREMWESMEKKESGNEDNGNKERDGRAPDGRGRDSDRGPDGKGGDPAQGADAGKRGGKGLDRANEEKASDKRAEDPNGRSEVKAARQFIRDKIEAARWFIESIHQRRNTLMAVMQTIVALQEDFFKTGKGIRPMILKDVAERIRMDISTVSRVVNGKYVQTPFGVYELKYFFTEGLETDTGESISNREIKNILLEMVSSEDKSQPLSDQALAGILEKRGYPVARRTVSKYREQLNIPVARMRKDIG